MKRIYLASSWRNLHQPDVLARLRAAGHEVYDFRNPEGRTGFGWRQATARDLSTIGVADFRDEVLASSVARAGFAADFAAMEWADEFCLLLPCGRSAHLEAGWAIGKGKRTSILILKLDEPELMYLTGGERTRICASFDEVLAFHAEAVP